MTGLKAELYRKKPRIKTQTKFLPPSFITAGRFNLIFKLAELNLVCRA